LVIVMSRYSAEERQRTLDESRATIRRVDREIGGRTILPPVDTRSRNQRDRYELEVQEKNFTLERARERVKHERERAAAAPPVQDALIERLVVVEQLLYDGMRASNQIVQGVERELHGLRLKTAQLQAEIATLQTKLTESITADRRAVLDLPPLRRSVQ
jgi:hypothetical protein